MAAELLIPPTLRERARIDRDRAASILDDTLRRLARQEALCRHVLGRLAAAFLDGRRHLRLGFVRVADYARERLGMSGRELQELARVARGLDALPALAGAFQEGDVSWSHVRLLTMVATAETERDWLARARALTVRGLRAAIAGRGSADVDDDPEVIEGEPRMRFHLRCPRQVRRQWTEAAELASRMCGTRLPVWRAAEAIAAEGLSGVEGAVAAELPDRRAAVSKEQASISEIIPWEAVAAAMPEELRDLTSPLATYGGAFQLDARLRRVVRALQRLDWQMGRMLALVQQLRLYQAFGCSSLRDYVEGRLGLSLRRARALVALDRRAQEHPALLAAYREGHLSLARALVLFPVLHPQTAEAWVTLAQEVTVRRLEDLVAFALEAAEPGTAVMPPPAEGPLIAAEVQMCARRCDATIAFDGPVTVVGLLWATIRAYTPAGEPAWRGLQRLLEHVTATWTTQPRVHDPIFARDGWRCAVPACTARASLHDHHVVYRSRGGDNRRENRVAICAAHHLQGIHRGRLTVTGQAPDDLTWELGLHRGAAPLIRTHGDCYLKGSAP